MTTVRFTYPTPSVFTKPIEPGAPVRDEQGNDVGQVVRVIVLDDSSLEVWAEITEPAAVARITAGSGPYASA